MENMRQGGIKRLDRRQRRVLTFLLCVVLACAAVFVALEAYIGAESRTEIHGDPKLMIIFGCQLKASGPSVLLRDRLDTALDYLEDHPGMTVVVTGGQGRDEPEPEGRGMEKYLRSQGFAGEIIVEAQSRSTWQNIQYTYPLLLAEGIDVTEGVLLVSNGFHLARIKLLWARTTGMLEPSVLAAPVSDTPAGIRMFFREPLALVKSFLFDRQSVPHGDANEKVME